MKLIKTLFSFVFVFISAATMAATGSEQLNNLLSSFESISADFTQTAIIKQKVAKKSSGTMALQRPGKFRWEIISPNHQVIIADGKYLWIYDVDLEQATKQSLSKDAHSPAILLSGSTAALEDRFTLINSKNNGNQVSFKLKPKHNQDMIQQIELGFSNKKLSEMIVVDNLGQKNVFNFSNVKVNPNLTNRLFQFNAPKGVDIIEN